MKPRNHIDISVVEAAESEGDHHLISRMTEEQLLTPRTLEQRRLIHASMPDPEQLDLVRDLRTNVLTRGLTRNRVIMVTGVSHGCGASYLARNLAASIALDEERTALLIECDHRQPSLAHDFHLPKNSPGLLDLFGSDVNDVGSIIYASGVERLRVIPAGRCGRRGMEFYASVRMRALVNEMRHRYDDRFIVIDAPPVLGSPDARILAEYADLIILVVGEGRHRPEVIRRAADKLPPERFAGVAFNQLP
jgi:Mrp family chromosome partitioning ATPase